MAVPKGYKHNWAYHGRWNETKKRPGLWTFSFKATKRTRAKSMGEFKPGTTGAWRIQGIQYIKKTGKGEYQTKLIGTKKPLKFNIKKRYKRAIRQKRHRNRRNNRNKQY